MERRTLIFLIATMVTFLMWTTTDTQEMAKQPDLQNPVWLFVNLNIGPPAGYFALILLTTAFWMRRELKHERTNTAST